MIIIILILLFTSPLYATDYYFSLDGDNSDGLTEATAFTSYTSISLINLAAGGQTLKFRKGDDFTIDADNESKNILLTANPVVGINTFRAYGTGDAPILPRIRIRAVKNYVFSGLHFKYTGTNTITSPVEIYQGSYNITLENCTVTSGGYSNAVAVFGTSHDITVSGCTVINGDDAGIAISASAYNCVVENCTTVNCEVNGICVFNGAHDNIIRNNTFQSSRVGEGAAIEIGWGNPYDNLVYGNACAGNNIGLFVSGTGNHVYNNIVIDRNFIIGLVVSANADPATNLHYCKDNEVNNNTFIIGGKAGESIYVGHYMDADCESIDISGNTVHHNVFIAMSGTAKHFYYTPTSTVDGVAFNNNIYSDYFGFKVRLPDTTILSTFSAWQGQSQDINSFYTNPMIRKNNGVPYSLSSPAYINNIGAINYCRKRNIILSR